MSIKVHDFKYVPGENYAEYIKLLEDEVRRQREITVKAVSKIKEQATQIKRLEEASAFWKSIARDYLEEDESEFL